MCYNEGKEMEISHIALSVGVSSVYACACLSVLPAHMTALYHVSSSDTECVLKWIDAVGPIIFSIHHCRCVEERKRRKGFSSLAAHAENMSRGSVVCRPVQLVEEDPYLCFCCFSFLRWFYLYWQYRRRGFAPLSERSSSMHLSPQQISLLFDSDILTFSVS